MRASPPQNKIASIVARLFGRVGNIQIFLIITQQSQILSLEYSSYICIFVERERESIFFIFCAKKIK